MPFCPNCRTEYTGAAAKCNDCGAELVSSLPQGWSIARDPQNLKPTELLEASDQVQLDLVEAQLRAASIPSVRRPRSIALFVPASHVASAQRVLQGKGPLALPETIGLSQLHRVVIACSECDAGDVVDLLTDKLPDKCPGCGRLLDLTAARPILDRYADIMRTMVEADFEIELEIPEEEEGEG